MTSKASLLRALWLALTGLFPIEKSLGTGAPVSAEPAHADRWNKLAATFKWVAHEPFVHFLLLGALLFAFNEYLETRANHSRIEISNAQIDAIAKNYQLQYGNAPSKAQLQSLLDSFIREEVFYHEALKLNLDQDDEIIRRRLVQKYEFLQQDLGIPKEPNSTFRLEPLSV